MIIEGDDDSHEWMIQEITKENDHGDRDVVPSVNGFDEEFSKVWIQLKHG